MAYDRAKDTAGPRWMARESAWARWAIVLATAALAGCRETAPAGGTGGESAGGADAGGPSCTGTPVPCEERVGLDCDKRLGCSDQGACVDEVAPCEAFGNEIACTLQLGCAWKLGKTTCVGEPACGAFSDDKSACLMEPGCALMTPEAVCEGTAEACASLSDALLCVSLSGCLWKAEACGGSPPIPCQTFSSQLGCEEQPGCVWR